MKQTIEPEWNMNDAFPQPGDIIAIDLYDSYQPKPELESTTWPGKQIHLRRHRCIALVLKQALWTAGEIAVVDIEKGCGEIMHVSRSHLYSGHIPYRFFSGALNVLIDDEDTHQLIREENKL